MNAELKALLDHYHAAAAALQAAKDQEFPLGCIVVFTENALPQHTIVDSRGDWEPLDKIVLRLENGNVCLTPIEYCERAPDGEPLPDWIQRQRLPRRHCGACCGKATK